MHPEQPPKQPIWAIEDLLRPEAFPHEVSELRLRTTHISWVILTGAVAYKIKKPVTFEFIDASTLEQRRHFCEEELRLNRRLAPDLYVDVVPIALERGRASVGTEGDVVEYAVRMRQFHPSDELPTLLDNKDVDTEQMAALGELLAHFHENAAAADPTQAPEKTAQMYETVFGTLAQLLESVPPERGSSVNHLVSWLREGARELEPTFRARECDGFVREGHGDLHAANIVRHGGRLVPFDCIEFDPRLRWIDTMDDLAFLIMDLTSQGRADLATALLNRYLEITGDYHGLVVLPFYATYRALVRARVDALTAHEVPARAEDFRARMDRRLLAAASWTRPRLPILILMHGVSGSGKSWLSDRLIPAIPAIRLRSDLERKRLARLSPTQRAADDLHQGIYSPQSTHRTYSRLADCAESGLRAGFSVIVDASFLKAPPREMFHDLARRLDVSRLIVSCTAQPSTLSRRIKDRAESGADPSDATLAVLEAQLRELEPFTPAEHASVVTADTQAPHVVEHVLDEIRARRGLASAHK
jgi:aminoglycoside phosphotransferase family enzyme/predicted kinase